MTIDAKEPRPLQAARTAIRDHRTQPTGALPRRIQSWLMIGAAGLILLIVFLTGHPQPVPPRTSTNRTDAAAPASPSLIQRFQQELADREREQVETAQATQAAAASASASTAKQKTSRDAGDREEEFRRAAQSLFADSLVSSRRVLSDQPAAPSPGAFERGRGAPQPLAGAPPDALNDMNAQWARLAQTTADLASAARTGQLQTPGHRPDAVVAPAPASKTPSEPAGKASNSSPESGRREPIQGEVSSAHESKASRPEYPADGSRLRLLEGTVIETVLLTRLNGSQASPVVCQVTTPVYSADRQQILIPQGARVLGQAAAVQGWGDSRLAVSFHRLLMPDGHTYSLDTFKALDATGESGVAQSVNRHYLQLFGASIAIGGLSGLAQFGSTGGLGSTSFSDEYRQAAGASLASSATRILDRYLNVLPTITVREGYRIKVYLTSDFELPAYAATHEGDIR